VGSCCAQTTVCVCLRVASYMTGNVAETDGDKEGEREGGIETAGVVG